MKNVAETTNLMLDWRKLEKVCGGAIPCVVQDASTRDVLMVAYVNKESFLLTRETGRAVFWSTTRNCLWKKGEESGNFLYVKEIRVNCEQNSLLYLVDLAGDGACHTRDKKGNYRKSCFYRKIEGDSLVFKKEE